jgi:hypothetical protein
MNVRRCAPIGSIRSNLTAFIPRFVSSDDPTAIAETNSHASGGAPSRTGKSQRANVVPMIAMIDSSTVLRAMWARITVQPRRRLARTKCAFCKGAGVGMDTCVTRPSHARTYAASVIARPSAMSDFVINGGGIGNP